MSTPELHVFPDAGAAARAAARAIAERAREATAGRGRCLVALSGGRTPRTMLGALVTCVLPWRELHVFQVDERAAPHGHGDRNLTQIEDTLLGATPLTRDQLHPMPVDRGDLESSAEEYAGILAGEAGNPPILDIVHLGLGDDGHTASLVPGDPVLEEHDRDVAVSERYQGLRRMTLTYPILNRARSRLWLVTGAGKADMLMRLLACDPGIPAGRVNPDDATVFADTDAAANV